MRTIIRERHPVARKRHCCAICGCAIEPGTKYFHQVNDNDGFCDFKAHEECMNYLQDCNDDPYNDEVSPNQTYCWINDDLDDILGKEAANEFKEKHSIFECIKFVQEYEKTIKQSYN